MYYTASRGGLQGVFAIFAHLSGSDKASPSGSNGDDRRQRRKQGGAVGAAASRMRARAKQTLGAATRAVSPQVTERARMLTVIRGRGDSIALTKSLLIAAWAVLSCRACPLRRFAPALPKGEPLAAVVAVAPTEGRLWHTGKLCLFARGSPTRGAGGRKPD